MTTAVLPRPTPLTLQYALLMWLIAIGLLSLVAVGGLRVDRQTRYLYLGDQQGNVVLNSRGNGILLDRRESRWDLVIGTARVPLMRWEE